MNLEKRVILKSMELLFDRFKSIDFDVIWWIRYFSERSLLSIAMFNKYLFFLKDRTLRSNVDTA